MDKKHQTISHLLARWRGWIQAGAALLTNLHLPNFFKGSLYQGAGKTVCVPGLNCYSCPAATGACPIGAFQAVVGSSKFSFSYYITGFLILLGVHVSDTVAEADRIVDRICGLRVFEDANGKMNVNPTDAGAELLIVSQFTLFADCRSRRPGFTAAARPETAVPLYERVIAGCRARGFTVRTGEFGADMQVASVNDGPVTILLDTDQL